MITEQDSKESIRHLSDWEWRFDNIFWIKPADTRAECLFIPRPEQRLILWLIYEMGFVKLGILKARQLGFSTLLSLIMLDFMLFSPGAKLGLVDCTADDAEKKLQDKIKFAWEKMPRDIRESYDVKPDNNSEFGLRLREESDIARTMFAGKNVRGSTLDFLWISEWGPIQVEDAHRSDKIADGGLPAAEKGLTVIETTWRGGQTGRLWTEVVEQALKVTEEHRTMFDWLILFFPWYLDPELRFVGSIEQIEDDCWNYLDEVEAKAIKEAAEYRKLFKSMGYKGELFAFDGFDDQQRLWYYKVAWPKRFKRYEEYPTVRTEMFLSPQPGAIYPEEISDLRNRNRLTSIPILRGQKTWFSFDLGRSDYMPCCIIQWVGNEIRVVDYYCNNRETVPHYTAWIRQWCREHGVVSCDIILPHDSRNERLEAKDSIFTQFETGMKGSPLEWRVDTVDACASVWDGIDCVRDTFPYIRINSDRCDHPIKKAKGHIEFPSLMECLTQYHAKQTNDGQSISLEPVHDRFCHGADSLRTWCEGHQKGLIQRTHSVKKVVVRTGHGATDANRRRDNLGRRRVKKPRVRS